MPTVHFTKQNISLTVAEEANLLDAARRAGITIDAPCDGSGTCGKCRVKLRAESSQSWKEADHKFISQAAREDGSVLACQTSVHGDVEVEIEDAASGDLKILSGGRALEVAIEPYVRKRFDPSATATTVEIGSSRFFEAGDTAGKVYGLAVDIGTTTLVVSLVDLRSGGEVAVASSLNPQANYGQDVLSRIKLASKPEGLEKLHRELIQELNRKIAEITAESGISAEYIYEAVFSGNTTMLHLAAGVNPASLGKYPYVPALRGGDHLEAKQIGLAISRHALVYLAPIMSAYVGGDISCGMLATRLAEQSGVVLFVDIGTNGEMVLIANGRLIATSTAAGPALEGMNITCGMRASRGAVEMVALTDEGMEIKTIGKSAPVGLCGSGLLDVVGELAAQGGVDKSGRFQTNGSTRAKAWWKQWESIDGKAVFRIAGPVYLSQKDVRQVQLAKAAIRSGIELLLKANQLTANDVGRVLIAGSFGFHLRTASLINLGLLSPEFGDRVEFVGNTSKTGAQALLLNAQLRETMQECVRQVEVVELANDPAFQKVFVRALSF